MKIGLAARLFSVLCAVGFLPAAQSAAQNTRGPDSLGLQKLNESFSIMPIRLSIDLPRGVLTDSASTLSALSAGTYHTVWGRYQAPNRVAVDLTFRRDSGDGWRRTVTRRATPESIDVHAMTASAAMLLELMPKFAEAVAVLGPPEFCERDSILSDVAGAIFLTSAARWRRGDVLVTFGINFNARDPLPKNARFAPRFSIAYSAVRGKNTLRDPEVLTRHDSPCVFTADEIREHAMPLDSATYEEWRSRLQKAVP